MDFLKKYYTDMGIAPETFDMCSEIEDGLKERFDEIDKIAEYNQIKVISAMQQNRLAEDHLYGSTGYGYTDTGRDTLEKIYADVFHTDDALVRPQITCGTHALSTALSGNLRPGDEMLSIAGLVYDTLQGVIGIRPEIGSLAEFGIKYNQVDLLPDGKWDFDGIAKALENDKIRLVEIQRSISFSLTSSSLISLILCEGILSSSSAKKTS